MKNNEEKLIRKSALCWFFTKNKDRLSSDRIYRVRGVNPKKENKISQTKTSSVKAKASTKTKRFTKSRKIIKTYKQKKEIESKSSNKDSSGDECLLLSDPLTESFSEEELELEEKDDNAVQLKIESYYSVYYDEAWYIGRILSISESDCMVKFLEKDLERFVWPRKDDVQCVPKNFIFCGPLKIKGTGPFQLDRVDTLAINAKYKALKRVLK